MSSGKPAWHITCKTNNVSAWRNDRSKKTFPSPKSASNRQTRSEVPKIALSRSSLTTRRAKCRTHKTYWRKKRSSLRQSSERTTSVRFRSSRLILKTGKSFCRTMSTSCGVSSVCLRKSESLSMPTARSSKKASSTSSKKRLSLRI